MLSAGCRLLLLTAAVTARAQQAFINELHYDNTGTDTGEGFEIAGPAGTPLGDYGVVFYDGAAGGSYGGSLRLNGVIPNEHGSAWGAVWFPVQGLQNGAPDGLVLYHLPTATVLQRISYEGAFTAAGGVADGMPVPDIAVAESEGTPAGFSLQLTGTGTSLTNFTWVAPRPASPGLLNAGQSLTGAPARAAALSAQPAQLIEGGSSLVQLQLTPAPAAAVTYTLHAAPAGLLALPAQITVPAGGAATVPFTALTDGIVDGFKEVTVSAQPPDASWPVATARVQVIDAERLQAGASGLMVISRCLEPLTGNAPVALELYNASGETLDFSAAKLEVLRYTGGSTAGVTVAQTASGIVPPGAVLVAGDEQTGNYLVSQGVLPPPAVPFASQAENTLTLNAAGNAAFLLTHPAFTGNDALEVLLDHARSDVFGDIGHDPGTAWTGPGTESSANGTLTLRPAIATGSTGWRQPGVRFTFAPATLMGFGVAPSITDPYRTWTAAAGLTGLAAAPGSDPDGDGAVNLLEYAFASSPVNSASLPVLTPLPAGLNRRLRVSDPFLTFTVQSSTPLSGWQTAAGAEGPALSFPYGTAARTFTLTSPPQGRVFLRQHVSRP
jgi:hypothetical protein